jgi:hypothetical protein
MRKKPDEVPNESVEATAVPPATASWNTIASFALTLDGYQAVGQKECGQLANKVKSEFPGNAAFLQSLSLRELRVCLFFEQRRFNHFNREPQGAERAYINALLEAIKALPGLK